MDIMETSTRYIKSEVINHEVDQEQPCENESDGHLMEVKQEDENYGLGVQEDPDSIKYSNTQDYLDTIETVMIGSSRGPASISTDLNVAKMEANQNLDPSCGTIEPNENRHIHVKVENETENIAVKEIKSETELEEIDIKKDPDSPESKYSDTQYYLEIGETAISEPTKLETATSKDPQTEFSDDSILSHATGDIQLKLSDNSPAVTNIDKESETYDENKPVSPLHTEAKNEECAEKPFKCDICETRLKKKMYLKRHMRIHSGIKRFACSYCDKRFIANSDLQNHVRTHTGDKPYKCKICGKGWTQSTHLNTHMKVHTGEKAECELCHKHVTGRYLKDHMLICGGQKPFGCKICGKIISSKGYLRKHVRNHVDKKLYLCRICDKSFASKSYLKEHTRLHNGDKPHECHVCKKGFLKSTYLKAHMRLHSGEKPYECGTCDKKFTRKENLNNHLKCHDSEKAYKCKICAKAFTHSFQLKCHFNKVHSEQKSFQCSRCKTKFTKREDLKEHTKAHAGERPHQCEICNKKFSFKHGLKRHINKHSEEITFQ